MRSRLLQVGLLAAAVIGAQLLASASEREFLLTPLTMAACYALVALGRRREQRGRGEDGGGCKAAAT